MTRAAHWEDVYRRRRFYEVSWYRPHLDLSLEMLDRAGVTPDARIIDVGGGASSFVDDLLGTGFTSITVLDVSAAALELARQRLGAAAERVTWITGDVTEVDLGKRTFDAWHDRAAFHFLTRDEDRRNYMDALVRAIEPRGHAILAMFDSDGPERCSRLPVRRFDPGELDALLAPTLTVRAERQQVHVTPSGRHQAFRYLLLQHVAVARTGARSPRPREPRSPS